MQHAPRILTFDFFGTVVDWRSSLARSMSVLGAEYGIDAPWEAVADAWRSAHRPMLDRVIAGTLPWDNLSRLYRLAFDELAPRFGLQALHDAARERFVLQWRRLEPWPDVLPGLARLRERFIVAPLSNGSVGMLVENAKWAGIGWDAILSCEMIERYKPDPEVYRTAVRWFDASPHDVMMVAAHAYDLVAAKRQGLQTAFVGRPTEWGPAQTIDLVAPAEADVDARDFLDLARALEG